MFNIHKIDDGRVPAWEQLPASAITPKVGLALVMNGGQLAIATGATKPTYICMREKETACTAGDIIPVVRVQPDIIFETTFSAAATSVKAGTKLTLATNGLQVTATTGGAAEVIDMDGTAAGDKVRVRFVEPAAAAS